MKCVVCGGETADESQEMCIMCSNREKGVRVLSFAEKQKFSGVTIDHESGQQYEGNAEKFRHGNGRVYTARFKVSEVGFFTKLAVAGVVMAIFAAVIFVAIPLLVLFAGLGAVLFWMRKR